MSPVDNLKIKMCFVIQSYVFGTCFLFLSTPLNLLIVQFFLRMLLLKSFCRDFWNILLKSEILWQNWEFPCFVVSVTKQSFVENCNKRKRNFPSCFTLYYYARRIFYPVLFDFRSLIHNDARIHTLKVEHDMQA